MAATSKADLLKITEKEWAKLSDLLGGIRAETAMQPGDGPSIKDVVGHRAHWIDLFLGWQADGQAGRVVHIPAEGYKWNELKRYNADLRRRQAGMDWAAAQLALRDGHDRLLALLGTLSEGELYGGPMQGGGSKWTTGRWAEAAGASHYRSAVKYIRSALRSGAENPD